MLQADWNNEKHLIDIESLSVEQIDDIMAQTAAFKEVLTRPIKKVPTLRGKSIVLLFYENSTRTRSSFELAGKYLNADTINMSIATSSVKKGETLLDTVNNLIAMRADAIIIRHGASGVCHQLAEQIQNATSLINAGDGYHEHPTQALLDYYSMKSHLGTVKNKKIVIIGDILHSRVARSNIHLLKKYEADVHVVAPGTMLPKEVSQLGITVHTQLTNALEEADLIMALRIQFERHAFKLFPSQEEYVKFYGINGQNIQLARKNVIVMHPGPINRGIEVSSDVADNKDISIILEQVENGVAVRMAILYLLLTGGGQV